jgi:hypothetical protein
LLVAVCLPLIARSETDEWVTRSGFYHIRYESELTPLEINRIHDWTFIVTTPEGMPVSDAMITLTGGMPLHNHGLPTEPRMTRELGDGRYLVQGMRFHMGGEWELLVTIDVEGRRDTVIIPLTL